MTAAAPISGSVLVLHAGALGDCVLAVHLLRALARLAPAARFTLAARSSIAHRACRRVGMPAAVSIDTVELYRDAFRMGEGAGIARRPGELGTRIGGRAVAFDMVISLLGGPSSDIASRLDARVAAPVIHVDPKSADFGTEAEQHIVQQWLGRIGVALGDGFSAGDLLDPGGGLVVARASSCGSETDAGAPSAATDDRAARGRLEREIGTVCGSQRIVIVHPGSGGLRKCAPLEEVESLVSQMSARTTTCWMIGPDEVERLGSGLVARLQRTGPVIFEENADRAADLVAVADAFVGFDAGMTHVAALSGITTVALFGPTNPAVWRPRGDAVFVVRFDDDRGARGSWIDRVARTIMRAMSRAD